MSPADNTSALPAVISWLFRVTGAPHLAVGPSLLRALWHGMRCLTMSEIRRCDATHFDVSLRHFCSRSTNFPSALEVYHDYALYKFTIDIDIEREAIKKLVEELKQRKADGETDLIIVNGKVVVKRSYRYWKKTLQRKRSSSVFIQISTDSLVSLKSSREEY